MKKAKIMLMAITVLAVVGGALAFKAKTYAKTTLCTTDVAGAFCDPASLQNSTTLAGVGIFYTKLPNGKSCDQLTCPNPYQTLQP